MNGRVRFKVSQMLSFTFWVAMVLTFWQTIGFMDGNPKSVGEHILQTLVASAVAFTVVAFGILKKRPKVGVLIGVLAALFVILLMAPSIY